MDKKDEYGRRIKTELEQSTFVKKCREAGMHLKILENICVPTVKYNSSGKAYVGDIAYAKMFKSMDIWKKISASPSSLGVLISHLNCWAESMEMDKNSWCFVMEEDVASHENTVNFFGKLMTIMAGTRFKKTDIELVHLVYDSHDHVKTERLMKSDVMLADGTVHLLKAPKVENQACKHMMVGQGQRAYLIAPALMKRFLDHKFQFSTWIDMEVRGTQNTS